jgi:hypothetical protein
MPNAFPDQFAPDSTPLGKRVGYCNSTEFIIEALESSHSEEGWRIVDKSFRKTITP